MSRPMFVRVTVASALLVAALPLAAQQMPAAVFTDPPRDTQHPARMEVLHIPSGGVQINGVAYLAAGAGTHPTFVLLHGLPGNEKNLDLAQAVRRAGWNAITFNYRGSWGSPGTFRFAQNFEDADAVLAFLRVPANAKSLGIDTTSPRDRRPQHGRVGDGAHGGAPARPARGRAHLGRGHGCCIRQAA